MARSKKRDDAEARAQVVDVLKANNYHVTQAARLLGLPVEVVNKIKDEYLELSYPETINLIHQEQVEVRKRLHEQYAKVEEEFVSRSYKLKMKALDELEAMMEDNKETVYDREGNPVGEKLKVDAKTMLAIAEKLHAITEGNKTATIMDEMKETVKKLEENQRSGNNLFINQFNASINNSLLKPNKGDHAGEFVRTINIKANEQEQDNAAT